MNLQNSGLAAILISVCLTASSQLILRVGMQRITLRADSDALSGIFEKVWVLAASPYVVGGLGLFGLSAVTWLYVLSRTPVSLAYPFVSLGIVLTTLGGWALLGEPITGLRLLSIGIILVGIVILGASA